jgi:hypothetical protein
MKAPPPLPGKEGVLKKDLPPGGGRKAYDNAGRMTTQLGTPRGRYDEHISKVSLSKKPRFVDPVGKSQT